MPKKIFLSKFCELLYDHMCAKIDLVETQYHEEQNRDREHFAVDIRQDRKEYWYHVTTKNELEGWKLEGKEEKMKMLTNLAARRSGTRPCNLGWKS